MNIFHVTLDFQGVKGTANVLYPCEISFADEDFRTAISELINVRLPASMILIICPAGLENRTKTIYENLGYDSDRKFASISHIVVLPYRIDGSLCSDRIILLYGETISFPDSILTEVAQACISNSLSKTNYKLHPPHGYKFRKPSGKEVDLFLRAGNMLSEPALLLPFSYLILCKMPASVRTIYIDSFTILSFALRIQSLFFYFTSHNHGMERIVPTIEVFRSYDVSADFRLPNSDDYYIVISASSSNDLGQKLVNEHGADSSRIIHLLGVGPSDCELANSSIHFINEQVNHKMVHPTNVIGISTEEFMVSHGNTTPVRLVRQHVDKKHSDELGNEFYQHCLQLSSSGQEVGYGPFSTFSICTDTNHKWSSGFKTWLNQTVLCEIPITSGAIVHLDDPMSKKMAQTILTLLHRYTSVGNIPICSYANLENIQSELQNISSVTVVAFQDPGLQKFANISMQLRAYPSLHRNFVLGYAFPESKAQFNRMVNDIKLTPESIPDYQFSSFLVSPVGSIESHNSIHNDYGIDSSRVEELSPQIHPKIIHRLSHGCKSSVFFPSLKGEKLQLRGGSIFFSKNSGGENVCMSQEVVYLAVALALQQARDETSRLPPDLRFDSNPFIKTVINPTMFWRYNDGILQAAILRALSMSELDFSADTDLSAQFREIAIAVLIDASNMNGEAALEFLAAVASKKISLITDDFEKIESTARSNEQLDLLWDLFTDNRPF